MIRLLQAFRWAHSLLRMRKHSFSNIHMFPFQRSTKMSEFTACHNRTMFHSTSGNLFMCSSRTGFVVKHRYQCVAVETCISLIYPCSNHAKLRRMILKKELLYTSKWQVNKGIKMQADILVGWLYPVTRCHPRKLQCFRRHFHCNVENDDVMNSNRALLKCSLVRHPISRNRIRSWIFVPNNDWLCRSSVSVNWANA